MNKRSVEQQIADSSAELVMTTIALAKQLRRGRVVTALKLQYDSDNTTIHDLVTQQKLTYQAGHTETMPRANQDVHNKSLKAFGTFITEYLTTTPQPPHGVPRDFGLQEVTYRQYESTYDKLVYRRIFGLDTFSEPLVLHDYTVDCMPRDQAELESVGPTAIQLRRVAYLGCIIVDPPLNTPDELREGIGAVERIAFHNGVRLQTG